MWSSATLTSSWCGPTWPANWNRHWKKRVSGGRSRRCAATWGETAKSFCQECTRMAKDKAEPKAPVIAVSASPWGDVAEGEFQEPLRDKFYVHGYSDRRGEVD